MSSTPGARTPGERSRAQQTVYETNVPIDATGITELGAVIADEAEAIEVRVDSDAQDFDFNIQFEGENLFANEQSPTNAQESFVPNQNTVVGGTDDAQVDIDVSAASSSGGATADVMVLVEYRNDG